jgi:hypothetical protein
MSSFGDVRFGEQRRNLDIRNPQEYARRCHFGHSTSFPQRPQLASQPAPLGVELRECLA